MRGKRMADKNSNETTKLFRFKGHFYQGNNKSPDNTTDVYFFLRFQNKAQAVGVAQHFTDGDVDVDLGSIKEVHSMD